MATRNYTWLTAPTGTEGTTTVYVDSDFGSDIYGDGTRQKPYRTLNKAYNAKATKPTTIVCRGLFSEQMSNGNHACAVNGDYWGAATFDGQGQMLIYGFSHDKMIIRNVPYSQGDETVWGGSHLLAGVGRASYAGVVGLANFVIGVAGSSVCLHKTSLYFGYIGGNTAVQHVVYDSPLHNSIYPLQLAGYSDVFMKNCTVYGVPNIADRCKAGNGQTVAGTVLGRFAMVANEKVKRTFQGCVFASDVTWWWLTADRGDAGSPEQIVLTGSTSTERQQSLLDQLEERGYAANLMPVFEDCVFSSQTSAQLFNAPEQGDFTLIPGCDADWQNAKNTYCGALPPALHIAVMTDSTGVAGTWDERSVSGCLTVEAIDNVPTIAVDTDSPSDEGEILSKILVIDPAQVQLSSVWAEVASRMGSYGVRLWKENIMGAEYAAGETLPVVKYIVKGDGGVTYNGELLQPGDTVYVSVTGTTFALDSAQISTLVELVDPTVMDAVYCRCRSVVYARVGVNDDLQFGATYLNDGAASITYHNRVIAPGESFVCMWSGERFTCEDAEQTIAVLFDDTRVPASEWIPAAMMGDYFVGKTGGAIAQDEYGVPQSSGNVRAYAVNLAKSVMDKRYVQFCLKVRRYGTGKLV